LRGLMTSVPPMLDVLKQQTEVLATPTVIPASIASTKQTSDPATTQQLNALLSKLDKTMLGSGST
jgi:hypothetical protein